MSITERFRVAPGTAVRLADWDPDDTLGYAKKQQARTELKKLRRRLTELQYLLYAEDRRSLLVVLQGMDAAGKDGTIRHVMRGVNPQGTTVASFKKPSAEELDHDFLWRIHKAMPRRGNIGIFNRSHYEDVLVVRVHDLVPEAVWSERYDLINSFEQNLAADGIVILKFYLHIGKEEQKRRFQARLDDPTRHWKISPADFAERPFWDDYAAAFEEALTRCSTAWAPWFVIPANHKWFRNLAVASIVVEQLEAMNMQFPEPSFDVSAITVD